MYLLSRSFSSGNLIIVYLCEIMKKRSKDYWRNEGLFNITSKRFINLFSKTSLSWRFSLFFMDSNKSFFNYFCVAKNYLFPQEIWCVNYIWKNQYLLDSFEKSFEKRSRRKVWFIFELRLLCFSPFHYK